jgi:hypothetical protein
MEVENQNEVSKMLAGITQYNPEQIVPSPGWGNASRQDMTHMEEVRSSPGASASAADVIHSASLSLPTHKLHLCLTPSELQ